MKVYISQGHEKGIGLEVLFKTCLLMSKEELSHLKLLAFRQSIVDTLKALKLPYKMFNDGVEISGAFLSVHWLSEVSFSQSFTSLEIGMRLCEAGGVLYTLPTSKDQFPAAAGHTEYFRSFYKKPELGMFFSSPRLRVLLLSDHVAVRKLSEELTEDLIHSRLNQALATLGEWKWKVDRVLVSGFNPHSGEGGLIGDEDDRVTAAITRLKPKFKFDILGPLPGDTMLMEQRSPEDLLVYLFHDQGLGVFKSVQGFIGSNITLGLPYPRLSPDHGTSFGLYGKNLADHRGCSYSLREAIGMLKRFTHGKNSGHQS
ncbi:MAG TPA: 4-hydroxythreonine-4-phosphate dehydrogenase PdxA [Bacteriovoracaceae bacterium]|nr:4-hydroxythreonine-4-phosphate dehydrogenase PdxA [Bacteriovoracaceae bacterium]